MRTPESVLFSLAIMVFLVLIVALYNLQREIVRRKESEVRLIHLNRLYVFLSETNQVIVRVRDEDELFREIVRVAVEHGKFIMAWIGVPDPESRFMKPVVWTGSEEGYLGLMRLYLPKDPSDQAPPGSLDLSKTARCVLNFSAQDALDQIPWREEAIRRGYHSCAVLPIQRDGMICCALGVYSSRPGFFDNETLRLLDEVTSDISFALHTIEDEERRSQAENEIRHLNHELEERVGERTSLLGEANSLLAFQNEELTRASRLKSEFLARMSHEFRTPLNSIIGFTELLEEQGDGPLDEVYLDYVRHVSDGANHLLALVNDILDLSRIEAGRVDLRQEWFAANEAIREVMAVTAPLAEAKDIQLRCEIPAEITIFCDRTRFKQILYNLLSNAVKFTPMAGKVDVGAQAEYAEVRFWVADTGIGIPKEKQSAIFEEFTQMAPVTNGVKEGAGLGLTISKHIVELHSGRMWVESAPECGSRFYFTIPADYSGEPTVAVVPEKRSEI